MKSGFAALAFIALLSASMALRIDVSISDEGELFLEAQISKSTDSTFASVEGVCQKFQSSSFYRTFKKPICEESGASVSISGYKTVGKKDGFNANFGLIETVYEFNSSSAFFSGLISEQTLLWGAVPLTVNASSLRSYGVSIPLVLELPGGVSTVKNGDFFGSKAKYDLVELSAKRKTVYAEAKQTNWKFFSSLIIFLSMIVGILVVWVSYFYLKSKT